MPILNSTLGYGALTKLFHWLIVLLFALQYL
jgi:cytochrome b561